VKSYDDGQLEFIARVRSSVFSEEFDITESEVQEALIIQNRSELLLHQIFTCFLDGYFTRAQTYVKQRKRTVRKHISMLSEISRISKTIRKFIFQDSRMTWIWRTLARIHSGVEPTFPILTHETPIEVIERLAKKFPEKSFVNSSRTMKSFRAAQEKVNRCSLDALINDLMFRTMEPRCTFNLNDTVENLSKFMLPRDYYDFYSLFFKKVVKRKLKRQQNIAEASKLALSYWTRMKQCHEEIYPKTHSQIIAYSNQRSTVNIIDKNGETLKNQVQSLENYVRNIEEDVKKMTDFGEKLSEDSKTTKKKSRKKSRNEDDIDDSDGDKSGDNSDDNSDGRSEETSKKKRKRKHTPKSSKKRKISDTKKK